MIECPRCHNGQKYGTGRANTPGQYQGILVLDPGNTKAEDLLICLSCGCQFYRAGRLLHPHGIESGRADIVAEGE